MHPEAVAGVTRVDPHRLTLADLEMMIDPVTDVDLDPAQSLPPNIESSVTLEIAKIPVDPAVLVFSISVDALLRKNFAAFLSATDV